MILRRASRRGMTLIELVVALAITGMVMASGYAALSTMVDRRESANRAMDEVVRASNTRAALASWITGAELTIEEDAMYFRGLDGTREGVADDELTFRTNAATPAGLAASTVRLYVDHNDSTPERGLVASVSTERGDKSRVIELEPLVTSLDIRYLSGLYDTRQWSASWVSATVLPLAVDIRLAGSRGDSLPSLSRLPLVVAFQGAR
jgi:type II secretion system protein J